MFVDPGPDATLCTNGDTVNFFVQGPAMGGAWLEGCDSILFTPPSSIQGFFYPDHEPGIYLITRPWWAQMTAQVMILLW
ncbi:MAG: hypothetical protein IPG92_00950 [Flavobacteriales bacterium]|nr:hypothetical protein [Flavobacteriales bacterium]